MSIERSIDPTHIERIWRKRGYSTLRRPWTYPIIVKCKGKLFIRDGHHRMYSALMKRNQKTMRVEYIEI